MGASCQELKKRQEQERQCEEKTQPPQVSQQPPQPPQAKQPNAQECLTQCTPQYILQDSQRPGPHKDTYQGEVTNPHGPGKLDARQREVVRRESLVRAKIPYLGGSPLLGSHSL